MRLRIDGIMPAIFTPFTRGGKRVDYDRACAYANDLADRGVDGIFIAGTSGEGLLMSLDERMALTESLVQAVGKRIRVIVQSGCMDTPSTLALTEHAGAVGAHAVAIYTPMGYAFDDAALYNHYKFIATRAPQVPIMLYNIPRFTNNSLSAELIARLGKEFDNIVGMKDSSGDMIHLGRVLAKVPKGFTVINGSDEFSYQAYLSGAKGSVSLTANVVPEIFADIHTSVKKGNLKRALKANEKLGRVIDGLGGGRILAMYKEAVRQRGSEPGFMRMPHRECTAAEKRQVARVLKDENLT